MSECETCRYKNESWDSEVCDGCTRADSNYEADLISRKDIIDKAILVPIAKVVPEDKVIYRRVVFIEDIESLPSAEPKIGKWIDRSPGGRIQHGWWGSYECNQQIIKPLPFTGRATGEWRRVGHDIYECSLCHQNVMTKDIDCYSYCYRCGAKMEGGDTE